VGPEVLVRPSWVPGRGATGGRALRLDCRRGAGGSSPAQVVRFIPRHHRFDQVVSPVPAAPLRNH
jgi:hypothetical protein